MRGFGESILDELRPLKHDEIGRVAHQFRKPERSETLAPREAVRVDVHEAREAVRALGERVGFLKHESRARDGIGHAECAGERLREGGLPGPELARERD